MICIQRSYIDISLLKTILTMYNVHLLIFCHLKISLSHSSLELINFNLNRVQSGFEFHFHCYHWRDLTTWQMKNLWSVIWCRTIIMQQFVKSSRQPLYSNQHQLVYRTPQKEDQWRYDTSKNMQYLYQGLLYDDKDTNKSFCNSIFWGVLLLLQYGLTFSEFCCFFFKYLPVVICVFYVCFNLNT